MADHHELVRRLGPLGHQQRGGDGEHAHIPGLRHFNVLPEFGDLFDSQVYGGIDERSAWLWRP